MAWTWGRARDVLILAAKQWQMGKGEGGPGGWGVSCDESVCKFNSSLQGQSNKNAGVTLLYGSVQLFGIKHTYFSCHIISIKSNICIYHVTELCRNCPSFALFARVIFHQFCLKNTAFLEITLCDVTRSTVPFYG